MGAALKLLRQVLANQREMRMQFQDVKNTVDQLIERVATVRDTNASAVEALTTLRELVAEVRANLQTISDNGTDEQLAEQVARLGAIEQTMTDSTNQLAAAIAVQVLPESEQRAAQATPAPAPAGSDDSSRVPSPLMAVDPRVAAVSPTMPQGGPAAAPPAAGVANPPGGQDEKPKAKAKSKK